MAASNPPALPPPDQGKWHCLPNKAATRTSGVQTTASQRANKAQHSPDNANPDFPVIFPERSRFQIHLRPLSSRCRARADEQTPLEMARRRFRSRVLVLRKLRHWILSGYYMQTQLGEPSLLPAFLFADIQLLAE